MLSQHDYTLIVVYLTDSRCADVLRTFLFKFFFILEKCLWEIYIYLTGSHVDRPYRSVHCILNIFQCVQCMLY